MKFQNIVCLFLFIILLTACGTSKNASGSNADREADELVEYAAKYLKTPYRYGGTTSKGFDCSGFVQFVYKRFGYSLPRSSQDQSKVGMKVKDNKFKKGDLVFFKGSNKNSKKVGHVGIITKVEKNGKFQFIHASNSGVRIDDYEHSAYYKARFLQVKRVISQK